MPEPNLPTLPDRVPADSEQAWGMLLAYTDELAIVLRDMIGRLTEVDVTEVSHPGGGPTTYTISHGLGTSRLFVVRSDGTSASPASYTPVVNDEQNSYTNSLTGPAGTYTYITLRGRRAV